MVSILLLHTLLISFSLDTTMAMNIPGNMQEYSDERFPYVHRDIEDPREHEKRPDHERIPDFPGMLPEHGLNPKDFDVMESREVIHRRFHEDNEGREEKPHLPLGSLLRALITMIKESGLVLGLGENFIQDILEGSPNAPSTHQLVNAAMRVANLPIFRFFKYAIDALRQDISNAIPKNIEDLTANENYGPGYPTY